jgi:outer membrane biosynthesis protein TonB
MRRALVTCGGSIAFHGAFVALAVLVVALKREPLPVPASTPTDPIDVWSGVTAAIGGERLVDVNVDALGGQPAPAAQGAQATPPPAPPPPQNAAIPAAPAPKPAVEKPALPEDPVGIEPRPRPRAKKPKPVAVDPAASASAVDPASSDEKPAPPSPRPVKRRASGDATGERGDGAAVGPFGAEGPSAVRSLGRAFTRAIPLACQADPGWGTLPAGDAGALEIAITVDETGHITGYRPLASDPPKQLVALVKRTIALLDAGTFALKGNVSAGVEVLRIHAGVSDREAAEAGGIAELSFGEGKAAFTQDSGRHVEVTVRVVKVDVPTEP